MKFENPILRGNKDWRRRFRSPVEIQNTRYNQSTGSYLEDPKGLAKMLLTSSHSNIQLADV
jgi:hypothetical protein